MVVKERWTEKERGGRRGKVHDPGRIRGEGQNDRADERMEVVEKMRGRNK